MMHISSNADYGSSQARVVARAQSPVCVIHSSVMPTPLRGSGSFIGRGCPNDDCAMLVFNSCTMENPSAVGPR